MAEFNFEPNDEVFNLLTRKVGVILNVKEIVTHLSSEKKKYVRVHIKPDWPDEIWAVDEIALGYAKRR